MILKSYSSETSDEEISYEQEQNTFYFKNFTTRV